MIVGLSVAWTSDLRGVDETLRGSKPVMGDGKADCPLEACEISDVLLVDMDDEDEVVASRMYSTTSHV